MSVDTGDQPTAIIRHGESKNRATYKFLIYMVKHKNFNLYQFNINV